MDFTVLRLESLIDSTSFDCFLRSFLFIRNLSIDQFRLKLFKHLGLRMEVRL
jgi:hypothetical protein